MARCLLLASLIALAVAVGLAASPVQNPGVQDCGAPLAFVVANRTSVKVSVDGPNAPPNAPTLLLQPTCRERVDVQLLRALVAFSAFLVLGLLGAVIGLVDDRWQYHRAPRFETLLRDRPADAPGHIRPPPVVAPDDVGRALPPVESPDVWILVGLSALVIVALSIFAGWRAVSDAIGGAGTAGLVGLGVLEVGLLAIGGAQLWLSQPEPPPEPLTPVEAAEVALGASAATRLLPGLGPLGFDAQALVARGDERGPALRGQQARQFAGLAVHVVLLVGLALIGLGDRPPVTLPAGWWAVAAVGGLLVLVGAARGVGRWSRLVVKPRWSALRDLAVGDRGRGAWLLGSSFGMTLLHGLTFALAVGLASSIEGGLPASATVLKLLLVYVVAAVAGTVSPTPGGLGAFDATAVLALLLVGLPAGSAVAGVLLYRLATLWLPVVVGLVPFTRFRRRWRQLP
jgi:undecaprenyl-diphosphatase